MGARIQSLPPEILRHILCIGYDDRGFPYGKCIPRKRWPFIHLARQVCSEWRAIADNPPNPHFWVARPLLEVSDNDAKPFGSRSQYHRPFARRLIDFRNCLSTSEGCDLVISIIFPHFYSNENIEEHSPDAALVLRLLLHGMQFILAYQSQVTSIEIGGLVPLAWCQFISLIVTKFRKAHILEEIRLWPDPGVPNIPEMTEVLRLSEAIGFQHLHTYSIGQVHPPLFLDHLPRLDRLALPDATWLVNLKSSISHLTISRCPSPDLLFEPLRTHTTLPEILTTISVGSPDSFLSVRNYNDDKFKTASSHSPSPIKLPCLKSISLQLVSPDWVNFFFKGTVTPVLERIFLSLSQDNDRMSPTEEKGMGYPNNTPTLLTSLVTLIVYSEISRSLLKLLKMLTSSSIKSLHFYILNSRNLKELAKEELLSQMAEVISHIDPHSLHLGASYRVIHYILHHVNLQQIQFLDVIFDDSPVGDMPDPWDVSSEFFQSISHSGKRRVSSPIQSYKRHDATNLEENQVGDSTPFIRPLSVEAIKLTTHMIHNPANLNIWELTPYVHSLSINIKPSRVPVVSHNVIEIEECIESIVGLISPKEEHTPPLLHLQSFSLTYEMQFSQVNLQEPFQSKIPSHGELYKHIKTMIMTREEFGAVPLELEPIQVHEIRKFGCGNCEFHIRIIAEAQNVTC